MSPAKIAYILQNPAKASSDDVVALCRLAVHHGRCIDALYCIRDIAAPLLPAAKCRGGAISDIYQIASREISSEPAPGLADTSGD